MAEAGVVVVDGKRTKIHRHTGIVTRARKYGVDMPRIGLKLRAGWAARSTGSPATMEHHELRIVDGAGRQRDFTLIDTPIEVREGDKATVVWVVPEDVHAGPHIRVYNHDTGERTDVAAVRIASWFMQPVSIVWGSTAALVGLGALLSWVLAAIALFAPYWYFKRRATSAASGLLTSPEVLELEAELEHLKPVHAAAA